MVINEGNDGAKRTRQVMSEVPSRTIIRAWHQRLQSHSSSALRRARQARQKKSVVAFETLDMTRFRPCIDLHAGQVKQIVGGTLSEVEKDLKTNYVSNQSARHFAQLYRDHDLLGAHVIMLGPGNTEAARDALQTWPGHLQVGGGITDTNAREWIDAGAEQVRAEASTSFLPMSQDHCIVTKSC